MLNHFIGRQGKCSIDHGGAESHLLCTLFCFSRLVSPLFLSLRSDLLPSWNFQSPVLDRHCKYWLGRLPNNSNKKLVVSRSNSILMLKVIMKTSLFLGDLTPGTYTERIRPFIGFSNPQTWGRGKIKGTAVTFWVRSWLKNLAPHVLPIVSRPLNELLFKVGREW